MADYTNWVEASTFIQITDPKVHNFVWKYIISRNGLPYKIVNNNDYQYIHAKISLRQQTGQSHQEDNHKLCRRVRWCFWSKTTPRGTTNKIQFSLAYRVKAMALSEVNFPSHCQPKMPQNIQLNKEMMLDLWMR